MNWQGIFDELVQAETEELVTAILEKAGLMDDPSWRSLGGMENNFSIVGNQQADPTAAMVEKIINAIDAVLMEEAFRHRIDPEGPDAPTTMAQAVARFLEIRDGRLENITPTERTRLADRIQLIAVGTKERPCYLLVDRGEGQTPAMFEETFLSLSRSNKMRIPFVQGRFNAGGTGVLQYCGKENYQLIASRRAPNAARSGTDRTASTWGFTMIKRQPPSGGRKNSMYVYLAPGGEVPRFTADSVRVLPGEPTQGKTPTAYTKPLEFGTVIKLYEYEWKARSIATTEARFEVERVLHAPCLPFRIVETRPYRANYYATTVTGVWVRVREGVDQEESPIEDGFPAYGTVDVRHVGMLPYAIAVFRDEVDPRRIPTGVFFTLNGQTHGALPRDFVAREAKLDYLARHMLVSIDCTEMDGRVREDFFMASRDRLRRNEVYYAIAGDIGRLLSEHPGLRELNARRRARRLQEALENETESFEAFQDLIRSDPALASLFSSGERLVTSVGPTTNPPLFLGREFPSFFRISRGPAEGLVKPCPINWKCRVDFETDARNDYFERATSPGAMSITPAGVLESRALWNGSCVTYFRPPTTSSPGDEISVRVSVTDDHRDTTGGPFESSFRIKVLEPRTHQPGGDSSNGRKRRGTGQTAAPTLAMPTIIEVRKEEWDQHDMGTFHAVRIKSSGDDDDSYDFYVNMDNAFLLTEVKRARPTDRPIIEYWFKFGLALAALSALKVPRLSDEDEPGIDIPSIERMAAGLARVVVPIIRRLHDGPLPAAESIAAVE